MNRIINIFLIISVLVLSSCTYLPQADKVKITQIQGQVQFTDTYKPDAAICIPEALKINVDSGGAHYDAVHLIRNPCS